MPEQIKNITGPFDDAFAGMEHRMATAPEGESSVHSGSMGGDYSLSMPGLRPHDDAARARDQRGWGARFPARTNNEEPHRRQYKLLCEDVLEHLRDLQGYIEDGVLADDASSGIAEIQQLLEEMYDCPFGQGESLKSVVVALQSQVHNVEWTPVHVKFLRAAFEYLRRRWIITGQTAAEIDDIIEEFGLDVFRGTVSDADVLVEYHLEKVVRHD